MKILQNFRNTNIMSIIFKKLFQYARLALQKKISHNINIISDIILFI